MASTLSRSNTVPSSTHSSSSAYQPRSTRASPALDPRRQREINEAKRLLELLQLPARTLPNKLPPNFSPQAKESRVKRKRSTSAGSSGSAESAKREKGLTPPLTPTLRAAFPHDGKMERAESGLRHEVLTSAPTHGLGLAIAGDKQAGEIDRTAWTSREWRHAAEKYRQRAHALKRSGDRNCRPSASGPPDPLLALLEHTDASLMYLYAYWCDDRAAGRVVTANWAGSESLRVYVRGRWEREREKSEGKRATLAGGMLGLCYLVDAVVVYHLAVDQLGSLHQRASTLITTSPTTSTNSTQVPPPTKSTATPSPVSDSSPGHTNAISPASSASTIAAPTDLLQSIMTANGSIQRSHRLLATSKAQLPLKILRHSFPKTFHAAVTTELVAHDAVRMDPDRVDKFAWPIEMAMSDPVPHLVCFGRGMVREVAKAEGKTFELAK